MKYHQRITPHNFYEPLPRPAAQLYQRIYELAWKRYEEPSSRKFRMSREDLCHRAAWTAVKMKFRKTVF